MDRYAVCNVSQQEIVMIDAGSGGICILANFSEQFLLSDDEAG